MYGIRWREYFDMSGVSACFRVEHARDGRIPALTRLKFFGIVTVLSGRLRTDDTFPIVLTAFTLFKVPSQSTSTKSTLHYNDLQGIQKYNTK